MSVMRFKRFTKSQVLKQIGRELLGRFFGRFNGGSNGKKIELPPESASDDECFQGVKGGVTWVLLGGKKCQLD